MLKSPSKFLNLPFLKSLVENRCISPRGLEYSKAEVKERMLELEILQAEREIRKADRQINAVDHATQIREFQNTVLKTLGLNTAPKSAPSIDYAPSNFCFDTKNMLPPSASNVESAHATVEGFQQSEEERPVGVFAGRSSAADEGNMKQGKMWRGHKVISQRVYTKQQIEKDLKQSEKIMQQLRLTK